VRHALLLAALTLALPAQAAMPAWHGVWRGTIGRLPVRACLQDRESFANGSYYYLSRLKPIALSRDTSGNWSEEADGGAVTGRWTLSVPASGGLTGTWRGDGKTLPIALTKVAVAEGDEDPCGTTAFIAPRLSPVRVTSKPASIDGFGYTELAYEVGPNFPEIGITSFSYPPTRPGDRAINAALRLDPAKPDGEADYIGCMKMALGSLGRDGDFQFSFTPELVTPEYLSVARSSGGFCGGAHPSQSSTHLTFDRASGAGVDLGGWFTARGVVAGEGEGATSIRKITLALRAVVLKHFPFGQGEDPDCRDAVSSEEYWDLALNRSGIAFAPSLPHVVQACADTSVVPFAELNAFLSSNGRAGIARLER
jgi:hypothetical protein